MFEIVGVGILAFLIGVGSVARFFLNRARSSLDEIGLPMTFNNVFFLDAHVEAAAREEKRTMRRETEQRPKAEINRELVESLAQRPIKWGETGWGSTTEKSKPDESRD